MIIALKMIEIVNDRQRLDIKLWVSSFTYLVLHFVLIPNEG